MAWIFARGAEGQPTYYFDGMGHVQIVTGNRPWRNNNPGNLGYGPFAEHRGAIGTDDGRAIFPDYETGREAMKKRLFGDDYEGTYYYGDNYPDYYNMTIEQAIKTYAPPNENYTDLYILQVCWWTDLDSDTELWELTAAEQEAFCDAIMRKEGYNNDVNLRGRYNTFISPFDLACHEQLLSCHQPFTAAEVATPIILDLDGDGVETTSIDDGAHFDHDKNGFAEQTGWTSPDDGLLAWDKNSDGIINDGTELFNDPIQFPTATNGFQVLAQLDDNLDGKIDSNDAVWSQLKVWQDYEKNKWETRSEK